MNHEVLRRWVDALRSGEYRQTTGVLHLEDPDAIGQSGSFCCLGVLCNLALLNGVDVTVVNKHGVVYYDGERNYLPVAVSEWAGLVERNPRVDLADQGPVTLSMLNDEEHLDFGRIADLVEGQL